eukprot:CFRG8284T1
MTGIHPVYDLLTDALVKVFTLPTNTQLKLEKLCKTTLRKGQKHLNNTDRSIISRRLFGVCSLRRRLVYLLQTAILNRTSNQYNELSPINSCPDNDAVAKHCKDVHSQNEITSSTYPYFVLPWKSLIGLGFEPTLNCEIHTQQTQKQISLSIRDTVLCLVTLYVLHEESTYFYGHESISKGEKEEWIAYFKQSLSISETVGNVMVELLSLNLQDVTWPNDPVEALAVKYSLPSWLAKIIYSEHPPQEVEIAADAMNRPGGVIFRCNSHVNSMDELTATLKMEEDILTTHTKYSRQGLRVLSPSKPRIIGTNTWASGAYEVQDEGSQLISLATGANPGMSVIDLCCGRGGKALHLAAMLRQDAGLDDNTIRSNARDKRVCLRETLSDIPTKYSSGTMNSACKSIKTHACADAGTEMRAQILTLSHSKEDAMTQGQVQTPTQSQRNICLTLDTDADRHTFVQTDKTANMLDIKATDSSEIKLNEDPSQGILVSETGGRKHTHTDTLTKYSCLVCHDVDDSTLSDARRRLTTRPGSVDPTVDCQFVCTRFKYGAGSTDTQSIVQVIGGRGGDVAVAATQSNSGTHTVCKQTEGTVPHTFVDTNAIREALAGHSKSSMHIDSHSHEYAPSLPLADIVLVDAPCSSLGTLRRGPNVRWEIDPDSLEVYPQLQKRLLAYGSTMVKVGGVLVYATCTFDSRECGDVKQWFDSKTVTCKKGTIKPDNHDTDDEKDWFREGDSPVVYMPSPLSEGWGMDISKELGLLGSATSIQLSPHLYNTDGFFISRWVRMS